MIPYGRQDITQADIDAVVDVLQSDFLTQGPKVPQFENAVARKVGAKHAVAVNSATSALHIACEALGLKQGDWLWTTPVTFVASSNCGRYCGANIDFVDIDPRTYNLCPRELETKLVEAEREGKLPKVLVAVHLCGQPCDMQKIHALSQRFGFKIIEDACHAIGGKYQDQYIGNCRFSDITVFSFHPVKIITTAEGGMALTNDPILAEKMSLLRSHGVTRDSHLMSREPEGAWYYEQIQLGYNYRMTELQAALGIEQLKRLADYICQRHVLVKRYSDLLDEQPLILPWQSEDSYSAYHLFVVKINSEKSGKSRRDVFNALRKAGIGVNVHYIPIYKQPYYQQFHYSETMCPNAENYYRHAITLPLYPTLTEVEQVKIVDVFKEILDS